jgi:hypothetical protein
MAEGRDWCCGVAMTVCSSSEIVAGRVVLIKNAYTLCHEIVKKHHNIIGLQ